MRSAWLLGALLLAACGGADAGDPVDTDAEVAAVKQHGTMGAMLANAKGVSSLFVAEDPTLDPTKSVGTNADAVATQLTISTMGCAGAQIMHVLGQTMVGVSFGSGCSLAPLGTLSGSASAAVSKTGGTVTVVITFINLDVDGQTLNGTIIVSTDNGYVFNYKTNLGDGQVKVIFTGTLQLDGAGGAVVNGSGSIDTGATPIDAALVAVHHTFGSCYADAGSMVEMKTVRSLRNNMVMISEAITFDPNTPSTGVATVSIGDIMKTATLPAYGSCPHP